MMFVPKQEIIKAGFYTCLAGAAMEYGAAVKIGNKIKEELFQEEGPMKELYGEQD